MKYLPYIDGLRALAILLVLFFHAGIELFPSGFIGVDIFFVISGFLITGLVCNSLERDNFSFAQFYCRRLWRLQPVFLCLLMVTCVVALIYCLPDDLLLYSKSLHKASLYISNSFFSNKTGGYFASDGNQFLLLHTWSLSIEWQCYLILPLALYLLHRTLAKDNLVRIIYFLTIVSLSVTLYSSFYQPAYTYYFLLSRIFEFLIGSCVVFNSSRFLFNKYFSNAISLLSLFSIIYIATLKGVSSGFPNAYALVVCTATALLILAGHNTNLVTRLLSLRCLVFIGLISYSLYIWHWPLFAFSRYLGLKESPQMLVVLFALTFISGYASWRFIEKPARRFNVLPLIPTLGILVILPVVIIYLGAHEIKRHEGYPERFSEITSAFIKLKKYNSPLRDACLVFQDTEVKEECRVGVHNSESRRGLMIGDSFSNHYWKFIEQLAIDAQISVSAQATASCLTLPGINQIHFLTRRGVYKECRQQTQRYYEMIKNNHYDYVLLGESWNGYESQLLDDKGKILPVSLAQKRIEKALDKALRLIVEAGSKPVLIKAIPIRSKGNPYLCFLKHIKNKVSYNPKECDYQINPREQLWIDNLFAQMESKYPQLIVIDPQKVLCVNGYCKADINEVPVFRDAAHLTDYASYYLGKAYLKGYKNPFAG